MKAKHMSEMQAEIDRLRAIVEAHEVVRDACFVALPGCQVWGDLPGYIEELRLVNAELVKACDAALWEILRIGGAQDTWASVPLLRAALGKAQDHKEAK